MDVSVDMADTLVRTALLDERLKHYVSNFYGCSVAVTCEKTGAWDSWSL